MSSLASVDFILRAMGNLEGFLRRGVIRSVLRWREITPKLQEDSIAWRGGQVGPLRGAAAGLQTSELAARLGYTWGSES